ncbi:MAG: DUF86 domain-containing protein [Candidatus Taylorbacteria bacterium]|nr:DUF86 domain-containing protein [Candidatus Taylorbacteria bacterium]
MQKSDEPYIRHVFDAITLMEGYVKGLDRDKFLDDKSKMIQDAVIREFEIIGEAVKRLSDEIKKKNPSLPWRDIGDMRNKLTHEYFAVDLNVVWGVIENDLPVLKKSMTELLNSL